MLLGTCSFEPNYLSAFGQTNEYCILRKIGIFGMITSTNCVEAHSHLGEESLLALGLSNSAFSLEVIHPALLDCNCLCLQRNGSPASAGKLICLSPVQLSATCLMRRTMSAEVCYCLMCVHGLHLCVRGNGPGLQIAAAPSFYTETC